MKERNENLITELSWMVTKSLFSMNTFQVQVKLQKLGIKTFSRSEIERLIPIDHTEDLDPIIQNWVKEMGGEPDLEIQVFLHLAAGKLWSTWFPDRPSDAVMVMKFDEGYRFLENGNVEFAFHAWTQFFHSFEQKFSNAPDSLEAFCNSTHIFREDLDRWFDQYCGLLKQVLVGDYRSAFEKRVLKMKNKKPDEKLPIRLFN